MKKFLFLSFLGLPVLFLGGCSLINNNDSGINTGDLEKISQLEQQLSGLIEKISLLQAENKNLKETLSGSLVSIQILESKNKILQTNIDKYKLNSNTNNTTTIEDNTIENNISYNNTTYNFNLTLPNTRNGYITNTNGNKINFGFNEQMPLFTITALTHNERSNIQNDLMRPTYLGQNSNYVFVYTTAQDAINQTIINRMGEINNIIQTFQTN